MLSSLAVGIVFPPVFCEERSAPCLPVNSQSKGLRSVNRVLWKKRSEDGGSQICLMYRLSPVPNQFCLYDVDQFLDIDWFYKIVGDLMLSLCVGLSCFGRITSEDEIHAARLMPSHCAYEEKSLIGTGKI